MNVVVLPAPLGPMRPKISPGSPPDRARQSAKRRIVQLWRKCFVRPRAPGALVAVLARLRPPAVGPSRRSGRHHAPEPSRRAARAHACSGAARRHAAARRAHRAGRGSIRSGRRRDRWGPRSRPASTSASRRGSGRRSGRCHAAADLWRSAASCASRMCSTTTSRISCESTSLLKLAEELDSRLRARTAAREHGDQPRRRSDARRAAPARLRRCASARRSRS